MSVVCLRPKPTDKCLSYFRETFDSCLVPLSGREIAGVESCKEMASKTKRTELLIGLYEEEIPLLRGLLAR